MNTITYTRPQFNAFEDALSTWRTRLANLYATPINADDEDARSDALMAAERRVVTTPIQTISDLRALTEIVFADPDSLPGNDFLAAIFAGLRKLDNNAASRTFDAANWLANFEDHGGGYIEREGEIVLLKPAKPTDAITALLWQLDTRGAWSQVQEEIRRRVSRDDTSPTWGKALSDYQTAAAKLKEHEANAIHAPAGSAENDAYEAKTDALADEHADALDALFSVPSPNAAGFRFKARLFADLKLSDWHKNHDFARIIASEAERHA